MLTIEPWTINILWARDPISYETHMFLVSVLRFTPNPHTTQIKVSRLLLCSSLAHLPYNSKEQPTPPRHNQEFSKLCQVLEALHFGRRVLDWAFCVQQKPTFFRLPWHKVNRFLNAHFFIMLASRYINSSMAWMWNLKFGLTHRCGCRLHIWSQRNLEPAMTWYEFRKMMTMEPELGHLGSPNHVDYWRYRLVINQFWECSIIYAKHTYIFGCLFVYLHLTKHHSNVGVHLK